jgi:hypothetical protein
VKHLHAHASMMPFKMTCWAEQHANLPSFTCHLVQNVKLGPKMAWHVGIFQGHKIPKKMARHVRKLSKKKMAWHIQKIYMPF